MTRRLAVLLAAALCVVPACSRLVEPASLDPSHTRCQYCRMAVSDVHFAAQVAAAGAEPVFFDDIGCLRDYLKQTGPAPDDHVAFVADHRTGVWVRAAEAVFTQPKALATPMGGGFIAHADAASRDRDPAAQGTNAEAMAIFGAAGPPNGGRK